MNNKINMKVLTKMLDIYLTFILNFIEKGSINSKFTWQLRIVRRFHAPRRFWNP